MKKILFLIFGFILYSNLIYAQNEEARISNLLDEFLEKVASKEMHDRFWSEDLIYTSSAGSRFGKAQIMSGFSDADEQESPAPSPYRAEDKQIRVMGDMAIVAFKLVNQLADGNKNEYWNSGTLRKEKGEWKVILWQATAIPAE